MQVVADVSASDYLMEADGPDILQVQRRAE